MRHPRPPGLANGERPQTGTQVIVMKPLVAAG
jgi:hypothetical protein